jgi:hypothetical protein
MDTTGVNQSPAATDRSSLLRDDAHAALAALMADFFAAVSFKPGNRPAYNRLQTLCARASRFVNASADPPEFVDLAEFIAPRQRLVDAFELTAFEEVETTAATNVFGNIAQRWSAYTKLGTRHGQDFSARGFVSTQFVLLDGAWLITSMAWDDQT